MTTRNDVNRIEFEDATDEFEIEEMDEEEIYFDHDDVEPDEEYEALDFTSRYQHFSARRRIEIAREDKWLQSAMADFEDFDLFGEADGRSGWETAY